MNADPAETALALMRDFFNTRPKRVLLSCLEDMDQDNSGMISFGEFERALKALNFDLSEADVHAIFSKFDDTGDGRIDRAEVLLELGQQEPESAKSRWFRAGIGKMYVPPNTEPPSRTMMGATRPTPSSGYQHCVRQTGVYETRPRPQTARARMQHTSRRPAPGTLQDTRDQALATLRNYFQCRTSTAQWNCFQDMDVDNSGYMSFPEFQRALEGLNLRLPKEDLQALFSSFDDSGDGHISIGELKEEVLQDAHAAYGREIGPETSSLAASKPIELCTYKYTVDASAADAAASFKALRGARPQSAWGRSR